jgi:alpha-tubulin suppressor-like RCC1 family protein
MPLKRISYGLLTSQDQGGGVKKQGLPPTVGVPHFSIRLLNIRSSGYFRDIIKEEEVLEVLQDKTIVIGGGIHSIALDSKGKMYAWGRNNEGQIGDGTTTNRNAPVAVLTTGALAGKTLIGGGGGYYNSYSLDSDGKLYAWGRNDSGQIGDGATTLRNAPVAVLTTGVLAGKKIVRGGGGQYHSIALDSDGKLYAWGANDDGQLGDGTNTERNSPVAVLTTGVLTGKKIEMVGIGGYHSIALDSDGKLYAWGKNDDGQLGDGTNTERNSPVAVLTTGVLAGKKIEMVICGDQFSMALDSDGKLYSWGRNDGQLGDGTTTNRNAPVAVLTTGVLAGKKIVMFGCGVNHSIALDSDGKLYAWGRNDNGQIGDGTITPRNAPVAVLTTGVLAGKKIKMVGIGGYHSIALDSDGKLYAWGRNDNGQLGDGTFTERNSPVAVSSFP